MIEKYNLNNKLVLIKAETLLHQIHCVEAVLESGGRPILISSNMNKFVKVKEKIEKKYMSNIFIYSLNATNEQDIIELKNTIFSNFDTHPDILINDSGIDFEQENEDNTGNIKLDEMMIKRWNSIIYKKLTSILLLTKIFGHKMAMAKGGVILNILSDIYLNPKINIFNPILRVNHTSLVAVTNGLYGFTKYIATYWNEKNIRSNSLTIGTYKENLFLKKDKDALVNQIPIGRLASNDEFKAAIIFLVSDASSYMTGSNLVVNGGRTCW